MFLLSSFKGLVSSPPVDYVCIHSWDSSFLFPSLSHPLSFLSLFLTLYTHHPLQCHIITLFFLFTPTPYKLSLSQNTHPSVNPYYTIIQLISQFAWHIPLDSLAALTHVDSRGWGSTTQTSVPSAVAFFASCTRGGGGTVTSKEKTETHRDRTEWKDQNHPIVEKGEEKD